MSTASRFTQDLPPKEGYRPIPTERVPLRTFLGGNPYHSYKYNLVISTIRKKLQLNIFLGRLALGLCLFSTVVGHYIYFIEWKRIMREKVEMKSAQFALLPILLAERDRT